jgi:hypothetical protein
MTTKKISKQKRFLWVWPDLEAAFFRQRYGRNWKPAGALPAASPAATATQIPAQEKEIPEPGP